jgi:hypothetical protein
VVVVVVVVVVVAILVVEGEGEGDGEETAVTVGALDSLVDAALEPASFVVAVPDPHATAPTIARPTTNASDAVRSTGATVSDGPNGTLAPWALRAVASGQA